jgi:hypothetical protein
LEVVPADRGPSKLHEPETPLAIGQLTTMAWAMALLPHEAEEIQASGKTRLDTGILEYEIRITIHRQGSPDEEFPKQGKDDLTPHRPKR